MFQHHLVQAGGIKHTSLQLCVSGEELELTRRQCEAYVAHMDYLVIQNQVNISVIVVVSFAVSYGVNVNYFLDFSNLGQQCGLIYPHAPLVLLS